LAFDVMVSQTNDVTGTPQLKMAIFKCLLKLLF